VGDPAGAGEILLGLRVGRGELGPKTSEKYSDAARSRSSSEEYSVLIILSSPGSSQCPPQLGARGCG
jgi:hypothetical protein